MVIRPKVDSRKNDFSRTVLCITHALRHHFAEVSARGFASGHMNDAVRAGVIATVLHFDVDSRVEPFADTKTICVIALDIGRFQVRRR